MKPTQRLAGRDDDLPGTADSAQWCEHDPPVVVTTPGGSPVVLHVTNYGKGLMHRSAVESATICHASWRAQDGATTDVTISVLIPDDDERGFATRTVVSTEPNGAGDVLDTGSGLSGEMMTLQFRLNLE
jgi:hypothetical protein